MRKTLLIAASLAVAACDQTPREGGTAGAETPSVTGLDEGMAGQDGTMAEGVPAAGEFVRQVAASDMYEIAAGNLAAERGEAAEVREFGQQMVADHTRSSQALKTAVAETGQDLAMPDEIDGEHRAQLDILRSLNGADFDREYMNQQLAAHRKALALLKAYGANGDAAELRQFAQATIPVVQEHHDHLESNAAQAPDMTAAPR